MLVDFEARHCSQRVPLLPVSPREKLCCRDFALSILLWKTRFLTDLTRRGTIREAQLCLSDTKRLGKGVYWNAYSRSVSVACRSAVACLRCWLPQGRSLRLSLACVLRPHSLMKMEHIRVTVSVLASLPVRVTLSLLLYRMHTCAGIRVVHAEAATKQRRGRDKHTKDMNYSIRNYCRRLTVGKPFFVLPSPVFFAGGSSQRSSPRGRRRTCN